MLPKTTLLFAALLLTIFFSKAHACCSPSNLPGCGNSTIENFVCTNYDVACCQTAWGTDCAELVHFAFQCAPVCGDGFCGVSETCSNCPADCGACDKSACSVAFNESSDPLSPQQWHIKNVGQMGGKAGNDANVLPVWRRGVYGKGVKIAIVDDGVQWTHPEIQCNYDADISYDFEQGNTDASPQFLDYHGTACAGVAAARDNNKCGRGVAFRATIAGIRILGDNFRDSVAASALSFKNQEIDIYSNSWGPNDDGKTLDEFPKTLAAIANGAQKGRAGKGNIFVWAAGNGRMNEDNSNYDSLANSPYTITVAATDFTGVATIYSEAGSNILVNAPSNNYVLQSSNKYKPISGISTADVSGFRGYSDGECTSNFGGTSSAAPLVAGVVAQMLDVNRNLTWRDVQHILVETARQNDVNNTEWTQNAAGLWFNPNYGFGRVNAEAAVAAAASWESVCNNMIELKQHVDINAAIPQSSADPLIVPITVYQDIIVEHVVVKVNADHASRGQVVFAVSSPQDTSSILSIGRKRDVGTEYKDVPFSTVQFWGENSKGTWNFAIFDAIKDSRHGSINYIDISIFGYRTNCSDISEPKDPEFRDRPVDPEEEKPTATFDIYAVGSIVLAAIVGIVALVIGGIVFVKLFVTELSQYNSFKALFE